MKLTDKQKKQIIAEYVTENVSQRELAKRFQVSQNTISKILSSEKVSQKLSEMETDNLLSMSAYINEKKGLAQKLISLAMNSVEEKIKKASLKDTITAIEKLTTVFKENETGDENKDDNEIKVTLVIDDVSVGGEND